MMNQPLIKFDWDVLDLPGIPGIAQRAAAFVNLTHPAVTLDADDLYQEACLILASRSSRVHGQVEEGLLGYVAKELQQDLIDRVRPELKRSNKNYSNEQLLEEAA